MDVRPFSGAITHLSRLLTPSAFAFGLTATSVSALTIDDTFLSSFQPTTNTAAFEAAIESASDAIASKFSNPTTVNILFGTNSAVLGETQSGIVVLPYNTYTTALAANATANPANTTLATAVANLGSGNGGNGSYIQLTPANARALGFTASPTFNSSGTFVGAGGQYDAVITLASNLMNIANGTNVILHEINEVLGGGGQGSTVGENGASSFGLPAGTPVYGSLDLYRYSAPGTPSYTTSPSATPYFSVNGGNTNIASFNQAGSGSDYGDFGSGTCLIQSAFFCALTTDTYSTTSPEYLMMESIGYNPISTTPLPSTWFMLLSGFIGFGFFTHRGTKKNVVALAAA